MIHFIKRYIVTPITNIVFLLISIAFIFGMALCSFLFNPWGEEQDE